MCLHRFNWVRENLFEPNSKQVTPLVCPSKRKITVFPRRAGTTKLFSAMALYECLTKKNRSVLYLTMYKGHAEEALWVVKQMMPKNTELLPVDKIGYNDKMYFGGKNKGSIQFAMSSERAFGKQHDLILIDMFQYRSDKSVILAQLNDNAEVVIANPENAIEGWNVYY